MRLLLALVLLALVSVPALGTEVKEGDIFLVRGQHDLEQQRAMGFKPRRDTDTWPLSLPLDWEADPFNDRNWRFQLQAWRMTDPILAAYFETGNAALLNDALDYALDWHRQYLAGGQESGSWWRPAYDWIERKLLRRNQLSWAWHDMATGIRALRIAFFIDMARRGKLAIDETKMQALLELADAHARRLQVERDIALDNHGIFQVTGLNLLCTVVSEREACANARAFANRMYARIMDSQFTKQGVHAENSPEYHFFVSSVLRRLTATARLDDPVADRREHIAQWAPWLVFPNQQIARIGDSGGRNKPLAEDPADPRCLADRCFAVADLSQSGYAIVRSRPSEDQSSMLIVTGMAHSYTHKHADELSFELFELGRFIFIDSGKYGYNLDATRDYVESAAAHNTISLEDRSVGPRDVALSGSLLKPIEDNAAGFNIEGEVERNGLFRQHRKIVYNPGSSLTITDTLKSDATRNYVSSLHLAPDLTPVLSGNGFSVDLGEHKIEATLNAEGCSLSTVRGQQDPKLGWHSVAYLKVEPTSVVRAVCPGRDREIGWNITFH